MIDAVDGRTQEAGETAQSTDLGGAGRRVAETMLDLRRLALDTHNRAAADAAHELALAEAAASALDAERDAQRCDIVRDKLSELFGIPIVGRANKDSVLVDGLGEFRGRYYDGRGLQIVLPCPGCGDIRTYDITSLASIGAALHWQETEQQSECENDYEGECARRIQQAQREAQPAAASAMPAFQPDTNVPAVPAVLLAALASLHAEWHANHEGGDGAADPARQVW